MRNRERNAAGDVLSRSVWQRRTVFDRGDRVYSARRYFFFGGLGATDVGGGRRSLSPARDGVLPPAQPK